MVIYVGSTCWGLEAARYMLNWRHEATHRDWMMPPLFSHGQRGHCELMLQQGVFVAFLPLKILLISSFLWADLSCSDLFHRWWLSDSEMDSFLLCNDVSGILPSQSFESNYIINICNFKYQYNFDISSDNFNKFNLFHKILNGKKGGGKILNAGFVQIFESKIWDFPRT